MFAMNVVYLLGQTGAPAWQIIAGVAVVGPRPDVTFIGKDVITMSSDDFRIRRVPHKGYKVWQRIGPGWEALSDVYATRADARVAVEQFLRKQT